MSFWEEVVFHDFFRGCWRASVDVFKIAMRLQRAVSVVPLHELRKFTAALVAVVVVVVGSSVVSKACLAADSTNL